MSALTEARKICPDSEYIILSLGTGTQTENYDAGRIKTVQCLSPWQVPHIRRRRRSENQYQSYAQKTAPGNIVQV